MTQETWNALQSYLNRLGQAEYKQGKAKHKGKRPYQHSISDYHAELVRLLGNNDEDSFKAVKAERGYASALGF